jgi:lipopolysaccharide transport system permease protein
MVQYSGTPDLREPRRFLRDAAADLRRSVPIAARLLRSRLRLRYRRSWLGYLWILLPAASAAFISLIASSARLFNVAHTSIPYPLFVLIGVTCWQLFADAVLMPSTLLGSSQRTLTQTAVPHEALLLSGFFEILLSTALRILLLSVPLLLTLGVAPGASLLLLPPGLLGLACLGVGAGLLLAPIGLLYDDVNKALMLVLGAWFFVTPVIYPAIRNKLFWLNPVAPLLDASRAALTGGDASALIVIGLAIAAGLIALIAWLGYRVARPHLMARLG